MSESKEQLSISEVASQCHVSDSRLRALAREQIRLPISTWLLWRKLEKAFCEIAAGASLVDAAMRGGFADQAHLTRTMKRMLGITPKVVVDSFR